MIKFTSKGDFSKAIKYFEKIKNTPRNINFEKFGRAGVAALSSATPVDTGLTAQSWYYKVEDKNGSVKISFCNSNIQDGVPIAIILQYGHGTNNGGWVQGRDYINPAIQHVFDEITENAWKEVTKA